MSDLALRPAIGHGSARFRVALVAAFAVAICVAGAGTGGMRGFLIGAAISVVIAIPVAGLIVRSRITVTAADISVRGVVLVRRRDRSRAASIVRALLVVPRSGMIDTVFVLDRDERLLLRVNGHLYASADLDRLVGHLGLPAVTADRPVTAAELATMYPGLVTWPERHPIRFGLALSGAVVVLVVIATLLVTAIVL